MRFRHFIHSVLLMMCLNSLLLLAAACMKTIPAETVNISDQLDSNTPLRRMPFLPRHEYSTHLEKFRAAKLFPPTPDVEVDEWGNSSTTFLTSHREERNKNAKLFAAKTEDASEAPDEEVKKEVDHLNPDVPNRDDNDVEDDRDLFKALEVEKTDICGSCPPLWMEKSAEMKDVCSNYESVSSFFSMKMDKREATHVVDRSDLKECTRNITCPEPHMLVKWYESDLCDVHAPSTGSLVTDTSNNFVYKCNGTHWSMHGFPLSSVVCAASSN